MEPGASLRGEAVEQQIKQSESGTTESLPEMTERIVRGFAPIAILLHGSQARGKAGPWSDVDLLVVLPEVESKREAKRAIEAALRGLEPSADITVATPDEIRRRGDMVGTVLRPALREGTLLYQRPDDGHLPEVLPVSEEDVAKETALWLVFADDDMALAELASPQPHLPPRHTGYNAQQAAEKALKAVYVFAQIQYPFSHDLDKLRDGLPADWRFKSEFPALKALSDWAVDLRYPGAQAESSREDARRHLEQARALIAAIRRDLAEHGYHD